MLKPKKILGAAVFAALALVLGVASLAFIQPAQAAGTSAETAHGGRGGYCGDAGLAAAAKALNMTTEQLQTQLWGGETLSSLATKAGVDLATVQSAVKAACVQATKDAIEQAVTDGTLTREKADWLIVGLDKGFWGADGGGFGFGPGGFGGHGRHGFGGGEFGVPNPNGTTTPGGSRQFRAPGQFQFFNNNNSTLSGSGA